MTPIPSPAPNRDSGGMDLAVSFPEGPTERSTSFVALYRNQFGVACWAYRDADDLLALLDPETAETLRESETDVPGAGAGAWLDEETTDG